jgi:hypothetical protein
MPKVGIAAEKWQDAQAMTGFKLAPALNGYTAEIYEVQPRTSDKTDPPMDYVIVKMELAHDELEELTGFTQMKYTEFFALTEERIGFVKAFLEGVGRCDVMREDADWDELNGTQFECSIRHSESKGKTYANIDLNTLAAISHDCFDVPEEEEEAPPPPKTKAKKGASPRRSPRAKVER